MTPQIQLEFDRRPSALRYMTHALRPRHALDAGAPGFIPAIGARWRRYRAPQRDLDAFARLAGLAAGQTLPALFVHATSIRLQMAILTHHAFPLPVWRVLQIRNHVVQRRALARAAIFDLEARIAAHRVLDKGIECDLRCSALEAGTTVWESLNTFYVRGRFGAPGAASPLARAPYADGEEAGRWRIEVRGALRFGELTGDYNGIHLWSGYARRFGFESAFAHPQRVLGQCLARLSAPAADAPQRVDAWLKGPAYYGRDLTLRARSQDGATLFNLRVAGDPRPALVGQVRAAAPDEPLLAGAPSDDVSSPSP